MSQRFYLILFFLFSIQQTLHAQNEAEADTINIPGVEVKSLSEFPFVRPISTISTDKPGIIPTTDVSTLISAIPNVGGVRKGAVTLDPVVRGFRAGQLNVQLNGGLMIEGGCPNRMDPTSAHVAADRISTVQVLKGPYAFRFGPNMGGVVRMLTKEPEVSADSESHFEADASKRMESNYNANTENASLSFKTARFAADAFAGRSSFGDYTSGGGEIVSAAFNKYHYGSAVRYENNRHRITLTADGSHGYNVHYPALPMDERSDDTRFGRAEYVLTPEHSSLKMLNISLYHSRVHHVMDNKERPFSDTVVAISDISTTAQGYRLETLFTPGNITWFAGLDGHYITKDGMRTKNMILQPPVNGNLPVKKEKLWNEAYVFNNGVFTELSAYQGKWFWILAARADLNISGSDTIKIIRPGAPEPYMTLPEKAKSTLINYSFSGGLTRFFGKDFSLGISLGRAMRSPDMTERYIIMLPVGYDKYDYLGNPGLKAEVNHEADITLTKKSAGMGQITGGLFFSYVTNYITAVRVPELPLTADVLGVKQFVNGEHAVLYGFECAWVSPRESHLGIDWNASLTYGNIYNIEKTVLDEYGSVTGTEVLEKDAIAEIPPFETNLILSWQEPGVKVVPAVSFRYAAPQNHISKAYYEQPSQGFFLMNASVKYQPLQYLTLQGGVNNLLDTDYYEHLNRRVIGTTADMPEPGRVWYLQLNLRIQ